MASNDYKDERIAKRTSTAEDRADRSVSDRPMTENREASDPIRLDERLAILRDVNTKLPQPPDMPGYHLCWLTTTNQSDPLEHRFRLGYELVKQNELPGFKMSTQQSGQVTDEFIRVNEMVLAKIDRETWLAYMKHLHHDLPMEQAENLRTSVSIQKDGRGRDVAYTGGEFRNGVSDGYSSINRNLRPSFVGVG